MRDFRRLKNEPPHGVDGSPNPDNIMVWSAVIFGPEDTCWDGGTFKLKLEFEEDYPNKAPKVLFVCPMFHPNVYPKDGVVCLDILQKNWSPIYDVSAVLTSVQSLLSDPNCTSPANNDAAKLFIDNRREYNKKVKEVVQKSWIDDSTAPESAGDESAGNASADDESPAKSGPAEEPNPATASAAEPSSPHSNSHSQPKADTAADQTTKPDQSNSNDANAASLVAKSKQDTC